MRVLGVRAGATLGGIVAAVLETDGQAVMGFGEVARSPFTPDERALLRAARACPPDDPRALAAAERVETAAARLMVRFRGVELVGFEGPGPALPGSGAILAEALGWPVVWDFRSADLRLGGQGGPLAAFYLHALARWLGEARPVAVLQLGGVSRLTWVDPALPPEVGCLAFDCGPGCGALDAAIRARRGRAWDDGGALAATGAADGAWLDRCLRHPFFARAAPKRLDPDPPLPDLAALSDADALATLAAAVASGVAMGFEQFPRPPARLWVAGGGRHHAPLMAMVAAGCDCPVAPVEAAGLDGGAVAAQALAHLAARVARGLPTTAPGTTGVAAPVGGGILSRPGALGPGGG